MTYNRVTTNLLQWAGWWGSYACTTHFTKHTLPQTPSSISLLYSQNRPMGGQIKSTNLKQEMKSYLGSEIPDSNISCLTVTEKKMVCYVILHNSPRNKRQIRHASSMFRRVRSGEWNLKLCSQSIYTAQTTSVGLHLQPQMLCRGQPALQFSHFQFYCSTKFFGGYVFGKNVLHIKFMTLKK